MLHKVPLQFDSVLVWWWMMLDKLYKVERWTGE